MIFVGNIKQITQIGSCAVGADRLNGRAVKGFIKPSVVIVFTDGGAYNKRIIVEVAQCSYTLIFLVGKNRL